MEFPVEYYFTWTTAAFIDGHSQVYLDKYPYDLQKPAIFENDDVMISLYDLQRIYSPVMVCTTSEDRAVIHYKNEAADNEVILTAGSTSAVLNDRPVILTKAPAMDCDGFHVPFFELMTDLMGKFRVDISKDGKRITRPMMVLSEEPGFEFCGRDFMGLLADARGQKIGTIRKTYFSETLHHLLPYRIFMPFGCESQKLPTVIILHGGSSNVETPFERAGGKLEETAQKRGYLLIGIDGGIRDSWYGCLIPNASTLDRLDPARVTDKKNPNNLSPKRIRERTASGTAVMETMERALSEYPADRNRLYIMGNSMGSGGTYHLTARNPGMFKAAAPSGGMYNTNFFPVEKLKDTPILFIFGTDDEFGTDYLLRAHKMILDSGVDEQLLAIGGHGHGDAWTCAIDNIFDFFDKNQ